MARISMDDASARSGVPRQTLEAWAERGLLTSHVHPRSQSLSPGAEVPETSEALVDEAELACVVEGMGWLHISARGWDGAEEE